MATSGDTCQYAIYVIITYAHGKTNTLNNKICTQKFFSIKTCSIENCTNQSTDFQSKLTDWFYGFLLEGFSK